MTADDAATAREAGATAVREWTPEDIDRAAAALVDAMAPAIAQQDPDQRRTA